MYRIDTTPDFDRDVKILDPPVAARIIMKTEWIAKHPKILKCPLRGMPEGLKRLLTRKAKKLLIKNPSLENRYKETVALLYR